MLVRTVKEIVADVILREDAHGNDELKLMSYALEYVGYLVENFSQSLPTFVKTKIEYISGTNVVMLPEDYMDYLVIGTQIGKNIRVLAENPSISDFPKPPPPKGTTYDLFYNGWAWDYAGSGMEQEQREDGQFSIDLKNRRLILRQNTRLTNIVLKYLSACEESSDNICLAPAWWSSLIAFITYKYKLQKKDPVWQQYLNEYIANEKLARRRIGLRAQDIINAIEDVTLYRRY
jgi:hypothetical protein